MESQMTIISGEFATSDSEGVISLSKKIGMFNRVLTKFGYTNIAIKQVLFTFKSRCSSKSEGQMNLRLMDRRMRDGDDQYIDGLKFDVKDWIKFSWSYPCWFHYKDFEAGERDLIEIEWDVSDSNMIQDISIGHYKVQIVYQMQNDITVIKCSPNVASKDHSQVATMSFIKKSKNGRLRKSASEVLDVSAPSPGKNDNDMGDYYKRKRELLARSEGALFPPRGVPIMS